MPFLLHTRRRPRPERTGQEAGCHACRRVSRFAATRGGWYTEAATPPSSSGPGRRPFKAEIRGSNPLGGTTAPVRGRFCSRLSVPPPPAPRLPTIAVSLPSASGRDGPLLNALFPNACPACVGFRCHG